MRPEMGYCLRMAKRHRLLVLFDGDRPVGLCGFFILQSEAELPRFFPRKNRYSTPRDHEEGTVLYLDQLGSFTWSLGLARQVESYLTERVPEWRVAYWHRPPSPPTQPTSRLYTYHRRQPHGNPVPC